MLPLVTLNPMVLLIINSPVFLVLLVQDIIKHTVGNMFLYIGQYSVGTMGCIDATLPYSFFSFVFSMA